MVEHDTRLDILGCLMDEGMTVAQLSEKTNTTGGHVRYHVSILDSFTLIREDGEYAGEVYYRAHLRDHPPWVTRTVNDHRFAHLHDDENIRRRRWQ